MTFHESEEWLRQQGYVPKTPEEERLADQDFEDIEVTYAKKDREGYEIGMQNERHSSLVGWFRWPIKQKPRKGDRIRVYTPMLFGAPRHGHALWRDGVLIPVEYKTKAEMEAERQAHLKKYEEDRVRDNAKSMKRYADLSFLPLPLQRRIERFRAEGSSSYLEPYEMAPVLEAARLLKRVNDSEFGAELKRRGIRAPTEAEMALRSYERKVGRLDWPDTPEWRLNAFDAINSEMNGYKYALMKEIMPEMDDGHSGNTWGAAIHFTRMILRDGDAAAL